MMIRRLISDSLPAHTSETFTSPTSLEDSYYEMLAWVRLGSDRSAGTGPPPTCGILFADVAHELHETQGDALLIQLLGPSDAGPLSWRVDPLFIHTLPQLRRHTHTHRFIFISLWKLSNQIDGKKNNSGGIWSPQCYIYTPSPPHTHMHKQASETRKQQHTPENHLHFIKTAAKDCVVNRYLHTFSCLNRVTDGTSSRLFPAWFLLVISWIGPIISNKSQCIKNPQCSTIRFCKVFLALFNSCIFFVPIQSLQLLKSDICL